MLLLSKTKTMKQQKEQQRCYYFPAVHSTKKIDPCYMLSIIFSHNKMEQDRCPRIVS